MNVGKALLLAVIFAAVGLVVMPSTVSLFHGQHIWYNISGKNPLPCSKCHYDVFEELKVSAFHRDLFKYYNSSTGKWIFSGTWTNYASASPTDKDLDMDCYACHRANSSITYANIGATYVNYTAGVQAHAASVVACMLCHQYNASSSVRTVPGFFAGGFANMTKMTNGNTTYRWVDPNNKSIAGTWAAHNKFIADAINDTTMVDANEACVACHTEVPVKINWSHALDLEFNASWSSSTWNATNHSAHYAIVWWGVNGTYNITVYGNASGFGSTNGTNWPGNYTSQI